MTETVMPIITGALGTVTKGLVQGLGTWKLEDWWRPFK